VVVGAVAGAGRRPGNFSGCAARAGGPVTDEARAGVYVDDACAPERFGGPSPRREALANTPVSGAATIKNATTAAAVALNVHARRTLRRAPTSLRIALPLDFPPCSLARRDIARVSWGIRTTR
jgi:hypothetical protein